ncbi:hypothetical protein CYY_002090 [Polysphondylium violaceum]|uniref:Uncharacterized protein n=1 Tax=Polysphondylium violaceum TaxID=133409 RepID=A0A8J4V9Y8_9MYCE|nr:hypothetical protein CYY_002090 [Polysphondylium violaceum]
MIRNLINSKRICPLTKPNALITNNISSTSNRSKLLHKNSNSHSNNVSSNRSNLNTLFLKSNNYIKKQQYCTSTTTISSSLNNNNSNDDSITYQFDFESLQEKNALVDYFKDKLKNQPESGSKELKYYLNNINNFNDNNITELFKVYTSKNESSYDIDILNLFLESFIKSNQNQHMINSVLGILSTSFNLAYNATTYSLLLEYYLNSQVKDKNELQEFVSKIIESKVKFNDTMDYMLVEYYLGNMALKKAVKFFNKTHTYNDRFTALQICEIIEFLILENEFNNSLTFLQQAIKTHPKFLSTHEFLYVLNLFALNNRSDDCFSIINFIDHYFKSIENSNNSIGNNDSNNSNNSIEDINNYLDLMYNNLIKFYSNQNNRTMSVLMLEKMIQNNIQTIDSFKPFIKLCINNNDEKLLLSYFDQLDIYKIGLTPDLIYHAMTYFDSVTGNEDQVSRLAKELLKNPDYYALVFIYAEKVGNSSLVTFLTRNLTTTAKDFADRMTNYMILYYLLMDDFESSLQWYTSRQVTFHIRPTFDTYYYFIRYSMVSNEQGTASYWQQRADELVASDHRLTQEKIDEIKSSINYKFDKEYKTDPIQSIESFYDEFNLTVNPKLLKFNHELLDYIFNKMQQQPTTTQRNPTSSIQLNENDKLLDNYMAKKDYVNLEKCIKRLFKMGYCPPKGLLAKVLDCIYINNSKNNSSVFLKFFYSIPIEERPLHFISGFYSCLLKFNINAGINLLSKKDFILFSINSDIWNSIMISLVYANLKLAISLSPKVIFKNKIYDLTYIPLLAHELNQILFKYFLKKEKLHSEGHNNSTNILISKLKVKYHKLNNNSNSNSKTSNNNLPNTIDSSNIDYRQDILDKYSQIIIDNIDGLMYILKGVGDVPSFNILNTCIMALLANNQYREILKLVNEQPEVNRLSCILTIRAIREVFKQDQKKTQIASNAFIAKNRVNLQISKEEFEYLMNSQSDLSFSSQFFNQFITKLLDKEMETLIYRQSILNSKPPPLLTEGSYDFVVSMIEFDITEK